MPLSTACHYSTRFPLRKTSDARCILLIVWVPCLLMEARAAFVGNCNGMPWVVLRAGNLSGLNQGPLRALQQFRIQIRSISVTPPVVTARLPVGQRQSTCRQLRAQRLTGSPPGCDACLLAAQRAPSRSPGCPGGPHGGWQPTASRSGGGGRSNNNRSRHNCHVMGFCGLLHCRQRAPSAARRRPQASIQQLL